MDAAGAAGATCWRLSGNRAQPLFHASSTVGTHSILHDSKAAITALAFANVRNDLLAFANVEGDLFLANLQPDSTSTVIKVIYGKNP